MSEIHNLQTPSSIRPLGFRNNSSIVTGECILLAQTVDKDKGKLLILPELQLYAINIYATVKTFVVATIDSASPKANYETWSKLYWFELRGNYVDQITNGKLA